MLQKLCKKTNAVDIPENIREAISCLATNFSIEFVKKYMVEFKKITNFCLFFYLHDRNNLKN